MNAFRRQIAVQTIEHSDRDSQTPQSQELQSSIPFSRSYWLNEDPVSPTHVHISNISIY